MKKTNRRFLGSLLRGTFGTFSLTVAGGFSNVLSHYYKHNNVLLTQTITPADQVFAKTNVIDLGFNSNCLQSYISKLPTPFWSQFYKAKHFYQASETTRLFENNQNLGKVILKIQKAKFQQGLLMSFGETLSLASLTPLIQVAHKIPVIQTLLSKNKQIQFELSQIYHQICNHKLNYNNYTGVVKHWWGLGFFFSSSVCQEIKVDIKEGGLALADIISAAVGDLMTEPEILIIAGLILVSGFTAWFIFNDDDGHGIVIDNSYFSGNVIWWHKQEEYKVEKNVVPKFA